LTAFRPEAVKKTVLLIFKVSL